MLNLDKKAQVAILLVAVIFIFGGYSYYNTSSSLKDRDDTVNELQNRISELEEILSEEERENELLTEALETERSKNEDFARQIEDIEDTVGVLDKLAKTDPELLQKYSKVYFLNEHYMPEDLELIDEEYTYNKDRDYYFHEKLIKFLEDMIEDAEDDGVDLKVVSAFRSFDEQNQLKSRYTVIYGSGANTFSADQGYSEHQLGTTVDFTENGKSPFQDFQNTEAYKWLQENAHDYGFILSYPPNNEFYQFEPWHWRFVGRDLAEDLYDDQENFYDLPQREIDKYLVSFFD